MFAQSLHIALDFGRGDPWRAVLFEALIFGSAISSLSFLDSVFVRNILRMAIDEHCAALSTVNGKVFFNVLLLFFVWKRFGLRMDFYCFFPVTLVLRL